MTLLEVARPLAAPSLHVLFFLSVVNFVVLGIVSWLCPFLSRCLTVDFLSRVTAYHHKTTSAAVEDGHSSDPKGKEHKDLDEATARDLISELLLRFFEGGEPLAIALAIKTLKFVTCSDFATF